MQFLRHASHISSAWCPYVANGFHSGPGKCGTFPSSQSILLGGSLLEHSSILVEQSVVFLPCLKTTGHLIWIWTFKELISWKFEFY